MSHQPHNRHQRLGGKLGPRIAAVTSQAMSDHLRRSADTRAAISSEAALRFFRTISQEKRQHLSPFTGLYLGHPDTPPEVEKLLRFLTHGQGEASEVLNMLGVGQAVGTSIGAGLSNILAPINQQIIERDPNALIGVGEAVAAERAGVMAAGWAEAEAAKQGIDGPRFTVLQRMAERWPGFGELIELVRRGIIPQHDLEVALHRQQMRPELIGAMMNLVHVHLQPADAALMVLRGIIGEGEGRAVAANAGLSGGDFDKLVLATGEPPGLEQLLFAYRRGFIDKARLDRGIKQSRVRDEWTDVVEKLRFSPASPADALRGVVQNHLSNAEGKAIAEQGGLRGEDWDWLRATEGNPPGVEQMLHLHNRGLMSAAEVEQGIRESRIKDKYVPRVMHLGVKLPEGRQVTQMLGRGVMSEARALELLRDDGYEKDVAQSLIASALSDQVGREKALAAGQIQELYHDHTITREVALAHLRVLGYHETNAVLLLNLTDLKRERTQRDAAMAPIRSAYVGHHIQEPAASTDLDALGIPPAERDYLLRLWTVERAAKRRSLTEAQVIKANVLKMFTDEVAIERLEHMGYTNEDARVLLDSEKGRTAFV